MAKPPYDVKAWQTQDAVDEMVATEYGNYADKTVRAGHFRMALKEADLGIKFARAAPDLLSIRPDLIWIRVNRAHALMFLDRKEEAIAEHTLGRGTMLPGHGPWETVVLKDFVEYSEDGRKHGLMPVIENLLQPAAPAP